MVRFTRGGVESRRQRFDLQASTIKPALIPYFYKGAPLCPNYICIRAVFARTASYEILHCVLELFSPWNFANRSHRKS